MSRILTTVVCGVLAAAMATSVSAQKRYPDSYLRYAGDPDKRNEPANQMPGVLKEVTFRQQLDTRLPMDAAFKDEAGRDVRLGDYFKTGKPVVFAFVYYQCTMLCTQVMNGISSALKVVPFEIGKDFEVVLVSFDPRDTPAAAVEKKAAHLQYWRTEQTAPYWHFLTGTEPEIRRVTNTAGFQYQWDPRDQQFAHVSAILVLTPDGRLSRYFYGIEYSPKDLRLALADSGQGKIGSKVDELLLFCFHYDPESGRYGLVVMNLIRLAGVITVGLIAGYILLMRRREVRAAAEGRA